MAKLSTLDLTNCDREPIHIPGSIQPHGMLLVIDPVSSVVLQTAGDLAHMAVEHAEAVLGRSLDDVLGPEVAALITRVGQTPEPRFLGSFRPQGACSALLDLTVHSSGELLVLELEPSAPHTQSAAEALAEVRRCVAELDAASDVNSLVNVAAHEARRLTGFDRVMIYRFLEDGAGSVVAEAKIDALTSWLNHHYPESDIPKQARALYLRNAIRVIPDAAYTPAPLCPPANPKTGRPLDMSDCALRSVSPVHLQYLRNMGVAASMSVSIIVDGALWGLVAFHHQAPKLVPYETREFCKHVGQILSQQIKVREDGEHHQETLRLGTAREKLLERVAQEPSLDQALLSHLKDVKRAVPADGAAVVVGTQVVRTGHAPREEQVRDLGRWLLTSCPAPVYETSRLPREHSPAEAYATEASGLLASVVSREMPILLLWFRAERVQTINWAGNPHKPVDATSTGQLTPRQSFEIWKETVRHQSRPWSAAEVDASRRLGRALFDVGQQQTLTSLNVQLRRTLSEKEALLAKRMAELAHMNRQATVGHLSASITHELNQPLGAILNNVEAAVMLVDQRFPDGRELKAILGDIKRDDQRASEVIKRLGHLLTQGTVDAQEVDVNEVVREVFDILSALAAARDVKLGGKLAQQRLRVKGDRVQLEQVILNLVVNGIEAIAGARNGIREIDCRSWASDGQALVSIRDSGPGIPSDHLEQLFEPFFTTKGDGMGMGLCIARTIIEAHGGKISAESVPAAPSFTSASLWPRRNGRDLHAGHRTYRR